MNLVKIETKAIPPIWSYVEEFVKLPLNESLGERTVEDVFNSLIQGHLDLWICVDKNEGILGILITQVVFYPQFKSLCLYLIGSKPHTIDKWYSQTWDNNNNEILKFCRKNNIKYIEGYARKGWLKIIKQHGFKEYRTVVIKEVE